MALLNPFEAEAIERTLAGDRPQFPALRAQTKHIVGVERELTGVGFFSHLDLGPRAAELRITCRRNIISGPHVELRGVGHGIGVVLFVTDGYISMLEGFTYDDPWPAEVEVVSWHMPDGPRGFCFPEEVL